MLVWVPAEPARAGCDAEIQHMATGGYTVVLEADITACFDEIDHTALMILSSSSSAAGSAVMSNLRPKSAPLASARGRSSTVRVFE